MKKTLVLALTLALASIPYTVAAKGSSSSSGSQPTTGFVAIEDAQRVIHFDSDRIWGTADGVVLVCPYGAETSFNKRCSTKDLKYAWTPLQSLTVPGYEISGLHFTFAGQTGSKQLLVFWRRKQ